MRHRPRRLRCRGARHSHAKRSPRRRDRSGGAGTRPRVAQGGHPSAPALLYRQAKGLAHLRASIPALAPLRWANAALWRVALLFERHSDPVSLQSDQPALPLVFLLLGASAGIRILIWPARSSLTPLLVPGESFGNAVTANTRAFEIATMAGPALGGFLVAFADFPAVDLLGAALECAFLGLLRPVRYLHPPSRAAG